MKVLFAVNNESISESITKKYQQEYKEIISVKNVYYFNAIIKELQKDKSYDRIVISEDLQPFSNNNYDQIDKFIFEKMDNISDEATNQNGNDIPIILICADRREKSETLLVKLFGIGVYNALIGKDRSITAVCQLLNRPRGKKEAKVYYHIDPEDVEYRAESEGEVSEIEIQNILNHYKRLGKNEEQYVESFDHIAGQYTDSQLRLIAKFLPLNVKAVLEANSKKYQEIISFGMPSKPTQKYNNYNDYSKKTNNVREKKVTNSDDNGLEIIKQNLKKNTITEPVIIPSTINTNTVKKVETAIKKSAIPTPVEVKTKESDTFEINDMFEDIIPSDSISKEKNISQDIKEIKQENDTSNVEIVQPKRRGRPKKNNEEKEETEVQVVKRGRGRPKKQIIPVEAEPQNTEPEINQIQENKISEIENDPIVNLFDLDSEENVEENMVLPGFENDFLFNQDFEQEEMEDTVLEQPVGKNEVTKNIEQFAKENNFKIEQPINKTPITIGDNTVQFNNSNIVGQNQKIVAFVGTSKNGTSFLVNNIAEMLSQKGINTAILDLTKNKNAYYIYTENEESLRKVAFSCIENLENGEAKGIQVHKNLTVYTNLPGEEDSTKQLEILETLSNNYSLIILDCDFETNYNYFAQAREIYLVQSPDILTIQPLTEFLRNLKAKNVLSPEKIRIVLNKMVKLKNVNEKALIGGLAYYNDPAMSFMTELLNKDNVQYYTIPFEEQTYAKYLDGIVNCKITLNGYSKNFMSILENLGNMVYPLMESNQRKNKYSSYNPSNNFSTSMNNTLNKMKKNY